MAFGDRQQSGLSLTVTVPANERHLLARMRSPDRSRVVR